jgi:nitrogen fixation protein FixH
MKPPFNPWPLGIVLAFAGFIAGTATLVVLACSQRSDLVRADYYDQEILHQQQMDRLERTRQSAPDARVTYDRAQGRLEVSLPASQALRGPEGRIHLYRPSAANLDRYIPLDLDASGQQMLDATDLLPGLWRVRVSWSVDQEEFQLDQRLVVEPKS